MVIRKGSSDDMFSIRDILLKMHSETTLSVPSIDMEKLTYHILHALKNGHVFVAVLKNKVTGGVKSNIFRISGSMCPQTIGNRQQEDG